MIDSDPVFSRESALHSRLTSRLKRGLSMGMQRLRDPDLGMVSISDLVLSRDMRHAKVYIRVVGCDSERDALNSMRVLNRARGYLRHSLGAGRYASVVPELKFVYDNTSQSAARLEHLLQAPKNPAAESEL